MHGAVDVQQHTVVAAPVGQARVSAETAGDVVVHDDRRAELFCMFGTLIHHFRGGRGHVQIVAFTLAGLVLSFQGGFMHEVKTLTPTHKRLAVDVFVVFGEI